jgi:multidrug resistance efflux pump
VAGAREALNHARLRVQRVDADQRAKIASDRAVSDRVRGLAQRSASAAVIAPVSGYIVNCTDRPQNVVDPGAPLFAIFEPDRAYVLAYFDPQSLQNVRVGQTAEVTVPGLAQAVNGRVRSIYPEHAKLPGELTRYFWQHVQWSQYRPVRVALDGVPRDVRWTLSYNAQVRVRIPIRTSWPTFGVLGQSTRR